MRVREIWDRLVLWIPPWELPAPESVRYQIEPGEVRVGTGVRVVVEHPEVAILEIDFNTKYADFAMAGWDEDDETTCVMFAAGKESKSPDLERMGQFTILRVDGTWNVIVEVNRYTGYVCLYKRLVAP